MPRSAIASIGVGLLALATGCTMCAHPYDYSGPTSTGSCPTGAHSTARAGSILAGAGAPAVTGEVMPEKVLSITDKALQEPSAQPKTPAGSVPEPPPRGWRPNTPKSAAPLKPIPAES